MRIPGLVFMFTAAAFTACRPAPAPPPAPAPEPEVLPTPIVVPTPPPTRVLLQHLVDSVLAAPMWRNARWGILMVDAERGDTLVTHDADRLFMPASNQKLLTGAIALTTLGPDYRWRTPVLLHGTQRGRTFHGRVLVEGSGDPSISDTLRGGRAASAFDAVADALAARGISRLVGTVEPYGDAMPGATTGYGWAWDDFDAGYSAAVDELFYNEGELHLRVRAGRRAGDRVTVERAPTRHYPALRVEAVTRDSTPMPPGAPRPARLRAEYDSIGATVTVSGTLAMGDSARLIIAYRHPADAFLAGFREALEARGIRFASRPMARRDTVGRPLDTLTVITSPAFSAVLPRMEKPSQNQMAELFFRSAARVATGSGSADSAQAYGARLLASWGIGAEAVAYRDGSGLSRHDYLTPRAVVTVLDVMRRSPHFPLFRDALPVAGVDGTIANRMKGTPAQGNVRAKTGTLDKTRSLSGYLTTGDGRLVLFSLLCNNFTVPNREVERVQDLLVTFLASRALTDPMGRP
jgi:D-alanyl-D-alanine carboxypeptidase/D-alanyl-D-alanine-endopeptidase (penicillin-binding protein 4)